MLKKFFIQGKKKSQKKKLSQGIPKTKDWNSVLVLLPINTDKKDVSLILRELEGKDVDVLSNAKVKDKKVELTSLKYYSLFGEVKADNVNVRLKRKYDVVLSLFNETSVALEYFLVNLNARYVIGKEFHENDGQMITFATKENSPVGLLGVILKSFKENG